MNPLKLKRLTVSSLLVLFVVATSGLAARQDNNPKKSDQAAASSAASAGEKAPGGKDFSTYQEDFSVLPISKNHLKLEIEILGERDDKPDLPFTRERWHLMWRPGDAIDLYVIKPRGVEKPPVVLYLYSYPQDTDRFKQDYWGGYTTSGGFAAVGFVSAVTGQRMEYRRATDDFFNQMPEALGASVHDVQMILNYLQSRGDLDMTRVGMFGQGSGGAIAILASAVDPRIKALDVLTPWGDWPTFLAKSTFIPSAERAALTKPEFAATVAGLDPVQWLPKVHAQSVRVQNVRGDGHMPDAAQIAMEAAAPQIAEIDQFGDGAALVPAAMNGKIFDWMRSQLAPNAHRGAPGKEQRVHYYPPQTPANPLDFGQH